MKIPLEVDEKIETPKDQKPSLEIRINLIGSMLFPRIGLRPIKFIVDTGSPRTFISTTDAIKFGLENYIKEDSLKDSVRMGETEIILGHIENTVIYFKDENSKLCTLKIPELCVAKTKIMIDPTKIMRLPSILGMDFLKEFDFNLHYLRAPNIAYLDK